MKTIAILAIVGVAALAMFSMTSGVDSGVESEFQAFMSRHGVNYGTTEEYNFRLGVFQKNLDIIARLNAQNDDAVFGVNEFADRTEEEMKRRLGFNLPADQLTGASHVAPVNAQDVDWTNMWDAVKDQGQCGSCWAFSATAAFESRFELAHGTKHVDALYSEQELVDCDTQSSGCNGGLMDYAFEYLENNAFCTEDQYPYRAVDGTCTVSKCSGGPSDKAYTDIPEGDEDALVAELQNGPVAVAVDANSWSFYKKGIMKRCGTSLDHGVTLVAVNTEEGSLKIRNSWGGQWGEKGYIRLALGKNTCGVANAASVPSF